MNAHAELRAPTKRNLTKRERALVAVMAAVDRAIASPHRTPSMLPLVASAIVGYSGDPWFMGWSDDGIRAVLRAWVTNAAVGELAQLIADARREFQWVEAWDAGEHAL